VNQDLENKDVGGWGSIRSIQGCCIVQNVDQPEVEVGKHKRRREELLFVPETGM